MKLGFLLTVPDSDVFLTWFYGYGSLAPYSIWTATPRIPFDRSPYSMLWYIFNYPRAYGYWAWNLPMLVLDTCFLAVVIRWETGAYLRYYSLFSIYFLIVSPQDYLIWLLISLGRAHPFFLVLAPLAKLPLLPPIADPALWSFIFSGSSLEAGQNAVRYAFLATCWSYSLLLYLRNRSEQRKVARLILLVPPGGIR